ncbi:polysaccharide pyruvyl transferase family protein [Paraburkholderia rhizosphaerae]|uniref:Polysaccharide pyruvyl transferase WcaK-like protein n=1 Tax=Paraburkholderia rhizosphaerae TaxID=480658 RepID=A0A4R8LKB0_9BURK|nr:polysaccharide pyruvyl transferase family protein [Paraburkholderia rhizosphaerae]TDY42759.1 polysaccharide pyruvyl transferase WcaK-like protein [Paraburkholderia rhizosphaerae]
MTSSFNHRLARHLRFLSAAEPDSVFLDDMQQLIDDARTAACERPPRRRGDVLRVLLLGYVGAGNTGADLRAIEIIRQLRRIFAGRALDITLFTCGELIDHPVLASVTRFQPESLYVPDALDAALPRFDVVLNVEGSTYTSKFSDALAGMLIGGVALAAAHGALACAYGVDAGAMTPRLTRFAAANATDALVFCRSSGASRQLDALGIAPRAGADTAWRFRAGAADDLPPSFAALCPNNPYWWPVRTDARRAYLLDGADVESPLRHGPLTFHTWDEERARRFAAYKAGFATVAAGLRAQGIEPVLVAMERLDLAVCDEIAALLPFPLRIVARGRDSLDAVAAAVAHARCVVTTRYHAAVLAIAHGVPAVGVSMDSRIDRLFDDAGVHGWTFSCDDPLFGARVLEHLASCGAAERRSLRDACERFVATQRQCFDEMGLTLRDTLDAFVES